MKLLTYSIRDISISAQLFNQELHDVISRLVSYCLYGDPCHELATHRTFNELMARVLPVLLERHMLKAGLKELTASAIRAMIIEILEFLGERNGPTGGSHDNG